MSSDILEINVGGRIFTTRRATLQFQRESMLYKLFDITSQFDLPSDSTGRPFIDSDGDTFALILDYLRRGGRLVGATLLSEDTLAKLKADSAYFGLTNLVEDLEALAEEQKKSRQEAEETSRRTAKEYRSIILGPFEEDLRKEYMDLTRLNNLCQDGWTVGHATFLFQQETYVGANMPRVGGFYYGLLLERETTLSG